MSWPQPGRYTYSDPDGSHLETIVVASPFHKKKTERVYYLTDDALELLEAATRKGLVAWIFAGAGWGLALTLITLVLIR